MKKIISLFFTIFLFGTLCVKADETLIWSELSQPERDSVIQKSKDAIFNNNTIYSIQKSNINDKYAPYLKDKDSKENFANLLGKNYIPGKDCSIYAHRQKYYVGDKLKSSSLIDYSIQYNAVPNVAFHYNSAGSLVSLEMFSPGYPIPPYTAVKYNNNGKMMRAYYADRNYKYYFLSTGFFQGALKDSKLYDDKGKQIYNIIIE